MLETALKDQVPKGARGAGRIPGAVPSRPALRRDLGEDLAPRRRSVSAASRLTEDEDFVPRRRAGGLRLRLGGGIPRSMVGRFLAGAALLTTLAATLAGMWEARAELLKNPRLVLASSSAIQITGNHHLTRAQLLTVFGEDVDRNILTVPLDQRRAELERLPWVEHATVMRLLPDHFRISIVERTPVAFVRQGSRIGLVDASGVLLDMASDGDAPAEEHYSFPVVTGISGELPLSTRAARMKLFGRFMSELGSKSATVSEVDLSNPEDVKALVPDGSSDILVHFGGQDFLHRYELYQKNLPGWKKEFPRLASADMRYERQVVLEMQPGAAPASKETAGNEAKPASVKAAAVQPAKVPAKVRAIPPQAKKASETGHPKVAVAPKAAVPKSAAGHLMQSFDVHPKASPQ